MAWQQQISSVGKSKLVSGQFTLNSWFVWIWRFHHTLGFYQISMFQFWPSTFEEKLVWWTRYCSYPVTPLFISLYFFTRLLLYNLKSLMCNHNNFCCYYAGVFDFGRNGFRLWVWWTNISDHRGGKNIFPDISFLGILKDALLQICFTINGSTYQYYQSDKWGLEAMFQQ